MLFQILVTFVVMRLVCKVGTLCIWKLGILTNTVLRIAVTCCCILSSTQAVPARPHDRCGHSVLRLLVAPRSPSDCGGCTGLRSATAESAAASTDKRDHRLIRRRAFGPACGARDTTVAGQPRCYNQQAQEVSGRGFRLPVVLQWRHRCEVLFTEM